MDYAEPVIPMADFKKFKLPPLREHSGDLNRKLQSLTRYLFRLNSHFNSKGAAVERGLSKPEISSVRAASILMP